MSAVRFTYLFDGHPLDRHLYYTTDNQCVLHQDFRDGSVLKREMTTVPRSDRVWSVNISTIFSVGFNAGMIYLDPIQVMFGRFFAFFTLHMSPFYQTHRAVPPQCQLHTILDYPIDSLPQFSTHLDMRVIPKNIFDPWP